MREIKFRVWTGSAMEYKIMAGFLGAFFVQDVNERDSACMSEFNTKYPEDCPVMQYTGLKSKSGQDIYDGDILKAEQYGKDYPPFEVKFRIGFEGDGWLMAGWCPGCDSLDYNDGPNLNAEVIGNIYENPELIKDKK